MSTSIDAMPQNMHGLVLTKPVLVSAAEELPQQVCWQQTKHCPPSQQAGIQQLCCFWDSWLHVVPYRGVRNVGLQAPLSFLVQPCIWGVTRSGQLEFSLAKSWKPPKTETLQPLWIPIPLHHHPLTGGTFLRPNLNLQSWMVVVPPYFVTFYNHEEFDSIIPTTILQVSACY